MARSGTGVAFSPQREMLPLIDVKFSVRYSRSSASAKQVGIGIVSLAEVCEHRITKSFGDTICRNPNVWGKGLGSPWPL